VPPHFSRDRDDPAMRTGPGPQATLLLACLGLLAGCAQSGPMAVRRTTVGTLKTSVSHLEYENEQLRREVAGLQAENREIEDRLAQEEAANGGLTAQLDDVPEGQTGVLDPEEPSRPKPRALPSPRTTPAGRKGRAPHKPPFAQIPGRIDPIDPQEPEDLDEQDSDPYSRRHSDDPGPQ